jgi:hypothetical protein
VEKKRKMEINRKKDTYFMSKLRGFMRVLALIEIITVIFFILIWRYTEMDWSGYLQCIHAASFLAACILAEAEGVGTLVAVTTLYYIAICADGYSMMIRILYSESCGASGCFLSRVLDIFLSFVLGSVILIDIFQICATTRLEIELYHRDNKK